MLDKHVLSTAGNVRRQVGVLLDGFSNWDKRHGPKKPSGSSSCTDQSSK